MRYILLKHFLDNGAELRFFGWRNTDFLQNKDMFAVTTGRTLITWTTEINVWVYSVAKQNGQE